MAILLNHCFNKKHTKTKNLTNKQTRDLCNFIQEEKKWSHLLKLIAMELSFVTIHQMSLFSQRMASPCFNEIERIVVMGKPWKWFLYLTTEWHEFGMFWKWEVKLGWNLKKKKKKIRSFSFLFFLVLLSTYIQFLIINSHLTI